MGKIKNLRGGNTLFVSGDGNTLAGFSSQNIAYVYDLSGNSVELIFKVRTTIRYLQRVVVSPDRKLLAAKSTTGEIAVFSLESGEEKLRIKTNEMDGYEMYFTGDSRSILDLGRNRIKLIDIGKQKINYLDDEIKPIAKLCPRVWRIALDGYSKQIYRFIQTESDFKGELQISSSDPGRISFQVVQEAPYLLPDTLKGISLCKERNYFRNKTCIVVSDKQFNEIGKIALPSEFENYPPLRKFYVSPCEKYILFDFMKASGLSYLYELETMKEVQKFEYPYVCDFTMVKDDTTFVISTWKGSFIGEV